MTRINKLVCRGFKSFAKRTELNFNAPFSSVIGPNGSGKCVVGDSEIALADGSITKIGSFVEEKLKTNPTNKIDDGFIAHGGDEEILCLNLKTNKVEKKPILSYVKRTSPEKLLKIRTKSGKEIISTKYHPLFILRDNEIVASKAEDLIEGVRIATPRKLNVEIKSRIFYELIYLIKSEDKLYVQYNDNYRFILNGIKGDKTWKELSKIMNLPFQVIKSLLDKQAINFAHLIKILKFANKTEDEIISLIPEIKAKNMNKTYKIPWNNSPEFSRFLGYLIAEGRLTDSNQIWFTNGREEIIVDYVKIVKKLFDLDVKVNEYKPGCWDVLIYSSSLLKILTYFGMSIEGAGGKDLTNLYLSHSSDNDISNFLNGYYSGDGYVSTKSIEATTKSKKLAFKLRSILLRLGIIAYHKLQIKIATNSGFSGKYYTLIVTNNESIKNFHRNINLTHKIKQRILEVLSSKKSNSNDDLIEANSIIKSLSKELGINIKKTSKQYSKLGAYCYNQCLPSREGLNEIVNEVLVPAAMHKGNQLLLQKVQLLSQSDIFWDSVVEIEEVTGEEWVYDLCVGDHHNFVANNLIVHNSNVIDALTFVLGRRSSKSMRVEKSANLIYNGGKTKEPAKDAEVSIHFDNKDKIFPVEGEEAIITRIVKQNGNSVYKINGKTHNRNEVVDLLGKARIDPDGYNIILQGDIIKFVEMATQERREIIEEIAGIGEYEDKKQKALGELERVDQRIGEANIILTERKTHLNELKQDRDQALEFKSINEDIQKYKATYLSVMIDEKKSSVSSEEKKREDYNSRISQTNAEIQDIQNKIKEKKEEIHKLNQEVEKKGEKDQVQLNRELEQLKVDIATRKAKLEGYESEVLRIKERRKELEHDNKAINDKIDALEREKKELEHAQQQKQKELSQIEKEIENFKKKNKFGSDLIELEKELTRIEKDSDIKEEEIQKIRQFYQDALREKDQIEVKLSALDDQMARVSVLENEQKSQLQDLKSKRKFLSNIEQELKKLVEEDLSLSKDLGESRANLSVSQQKLATLEAQEMKILAQSAGDRAVSSIMDQKKEIQGIYGTISELGSVKEKYSTALERSASGRINSIVVESDSVAEKCINYLKKNKLGSATFLPLNKMKSVIIADSVKQLVKKNGVYGLAIDLVDFDKKYEKAFNFVFGATLVVEDIPTARSIGVGTARMVTLEGDLVEISGAMQGGYYQKTRSGGFKQKELTSSLEELRERVASIEGKISLLTSKRSSLDDKITNKREEKAQLEGEIIRLEKSLNLEGSELGDFKDKKSSLRDLMKETEQKITSLTSEISSKNNELAKLKVERQEMREKINQLRNPSVLAQLSAFEEKRNEIKGNLIKIDTEIKSFDGQIKTILGPDVKKSRDIIAQNVKEEEKFTNLVSETKDLIKKNSEELKEKEVLASKFMKQFKSLFDTRDKLEKEVDILDKKIDDKEIIIRGIEQKLNIVSIDLGRLKAELAGLEKEFEPLVNIEIFSSKKDVKELQKTVTRLELKRESMGNVNLRALEVYESVEREYNSLLEKKETLNKEKNDVHNLINEIEQSKKAIFMKNFDVVNEIFKNFFSKLTTKGEAFLEMEDQENPFNAGVEIKVKLSSKKFMDIKSLSGGEKTLTALAFIFAIQDHNPASFYVMDEVDAALDKHNSEKLSQLIRSYSSKAQYIVISHNDAIISEADVLYGVSMNEHGMSQVTTLQL